MDKEAMAEVSMVPKIPRQVRHKIRNFKDGKCISCGKDRGDSPYKRRCVECVLKERLWHRDKYKRKPWQAGSRGRKPLTETTI